MRSFVQQIYIQSVQNRAMPLGNQTGMTAARRDALGRWVGGLKRADCARCTDCGHDLCRRPDL
jgi:uncharacterized membrane protein